VDPRLREILALNRAIAGSLDYEEVLALVVEKTVELTAAESCALLLAGEDGVARVAAQRGIDEELAAAFAAPFDERINVALRRLLSHARDDSFLGVPVIRHGAVAGLLVIHREGPHREEPEEEVLLSALADQAAIALDHASRYRELWRQSQEARRELEVGAERKDQYLAMLAHELRNPLAAITSAIAVLEARLPDDPVLTRTQQAAARQAQHMKRLLDDLLDVSRVTSGRISLEPRTVDLRELVAQAVQSVQPLYGERRHRLDVDLPEAPLLVAGDSDRLIQVISNLLVNAAKYSEPEGQVTVTAEPAGEAVELRVRDRGHGIPQELLPSVFDLFVQSGRGPHRPEGGLGIGLTLVRQLVHLHGGEVEAHSEGEGHGSEFVVRLPAAEADEAEAAEGQAAEGVEPAPDAAAIFVGRRILVVEDNRDVASALGAQLESEGHRVRVVEDGESALDWLARETPEVILVDIGLPGIDGFEVARRVRERGVEPRPLLVAVTGYGQGDDLRRSRQSGFDHHLVKPVAAEDLRRVLAAAPG
jgi:signal transduction histidine kinase/CheY-like chemotaxis protein